MRVRVILLLCVPELTKGSRFAWRIGIAIGSLLVVGCTPLIWIAFEGVHLPALAMPALGLVIVAVLLLGRRCFSVE